MTYDNHKRNPFLLGLVLVLGVTAAGCGEDTKLIGTGASLTTTPCDQCTAITRPTCAGGEVPACFKRTDGTCGWASQCGMSPSQPDAGTVHPTPMQPAPDAGTNPTQPDAGRVACPAIGCAACPWGDHKDSNGCPTCECMPPPTDPMCPSLVCPAIYCEYGHTKDDKGCTTCQCAPAPSTGCAAVQCMKGQHCELRQVTCVKAPCDPVPTCVPDTTTSACAAALCPANTVCREKQVTCIAAPCDPVAECVPRCGGIAGRPCPGNGTCQDDPTDSCNPATGGADCGGLCACKQAGECPPDRIWDGSPTVCACVKVGP